MAGVGRILAGLARGGAVEALRSHRKHRGKENRRKNRSIKENKAAFKRNERQVKQYEKDIAKFMKKYGGEKYMKKAALNAPQRKVLKDILGTAHEKLKKPEHVPSLKKIEKQPLFQAGQQKLLDLLGGGQDAYQRFSAPYLREFREKILPEIKAKYAGYGAGGSPVMNELEGAGTDLQERLARLGESLGIEALGPALQYGNAAQLNQQQRFENATGANTRAAQLAQLGLGTPAFNAIYRQATPPILPPEYQAGPVYQPQPSWLQRLGGAAAGGIGSAIGGPIGGVLGQGLAGAFQPQVAQNPQLAPRVAPQRAAFGGFNQLGGNRGPAGVF